MLRDLFRHRYRVRTAIWFYQQFRLRVRVRSGVCSLLQYYFVLHLRTVGQNGTKYRQAITKMSFLSLDESFCRLDDAENRY